MPTSHDNDLNLSSGLLNYLPNYFLFISYYPSTLHIADSVRLHPQSSRAQFILLSLSPHRQDPEIRLKTIAEVVDGYCEYDFAS